MGRNRPYTLHSMTHRVVVAVMAGWLPEWEPPLSDQSLDRTYGDRIKVELEVDGAEALRSVYERAIAAIEPRARWHRGQDESCTWMSSGQPSTECSEAIPYART